MPNALIIHIYKYFYVIMQCICDSVSKFKRKKRDRENKIVDY